MMRFRHRISRRAGNVHRSLKDSPVAHRLVTGAFWSVVGGAASRVCSVLAGIAVARAIGKEGFGEYGMVQSTVLMLGVLAGFGLGATATRFVADALRTDPARAGRVANLTIVVALVFGSLLAAATAVSAPWLADLSLGRSGLTKVLRAASLLLFCSTLNNVLLGILSGFQAFRQVARINLWQGLATPVAAVPLALLYGVDGAVASLTVNAGLGMLLGAAALNNQYREHSIATRYHRELWREWPVLWRFAFPTMLSGLMVAPVTWLANLILVRLPGGYGELGLFNAANQWRTVILLVPGLVASVMLPILSEAYGSGAGDFKKTVELNLTGTWLFCLPLTVAVVLLNGPLTALYGRAYEGSAPVMVLLMLSCFFMIVNNTVGAALAGADRMWVALSMNCAWGVSVLAGAWFLVPGWGAAGLAAAYLAAYVMHTVWQMLYLELRLAPTVLISHWRLVLFSLSILPLAAYLALKGVTLPTAGALILLSLLPALSALLQKGRGVDALAATGGTA